jgi:hypothetical protein
MNITDNKEFGLLLSGQILSRVKNDNYDELIHWLKESRKYFAEIIISTWDNEVNDEITALIDRLVINNDPGPDKPARGQKYNNKTRHFTQVISGLNACNSKYIFRTRVELFKMTHEIVNTVNSKIIVENLEQNQIKIICPAPGTLSAQKNGCPFFLTDIMIIAEKLNLIKWYKSMLDYQYLYKDFWDKDHKFIESFAAEQILGLALVQDFSKEILPANELNKLNRIFISRKMYSNIKYFYPKHVLLFNPNILGVQGGRWLNMREDYENKPKFLVLKFKPYLLFRFLGVKYTIRKNLSNLFRRIIPYNGKNSFGSIIFLRGLR